MTKLRDNSSETEIYAINKTNPEGVKTDDRVRCIVVQSFLGKTELHS